jgi:cobyrinic acid a,c-diamide synthase
MFARELSENTPMLQSIKDAISQRVPVYAECGGLMYLGRSLSDLEGTQYPMVGAIPVVSSMEGRRLHLGYREVESRTDSPLLSMGQRVRGHEFHWSVLEQPPDPEQSVYRVIDQGNRAEGFKIGSVWASYIHIHLGSRPTLAQRFVDTCASATRSLR